MLVLCRVIESEHQRGMKVQNVAHLFYLPFMYVPNEQVLPQLEKPTVAEILPCGARDVINMSVCRKPCGREVHAQVAHPKVRDHLDRAKVVILIVTMDVIESYEKGITLISNGKGSPVMDGVLSSLYVVRDG